MCLFMEPFYCVARFLEVLAFDVNVFVQESLGLAISSVTNTLSATKLELTQMGSTKQQIVRDVRREPTNTPDALRLDSSNWSQWWYYPALGVESRTHWSEEKIQLSNGRMKWIGGWKPLERLATPRATGVALRQKYFGEGAERLATKFREVGADLVFVGQKMVAKDSRFVQDSGSDIMLLKFHKSFCETQYKAAKFAQAFNRKLLEVPGLAVKAPRISFLDCSVYIVYDGELGRTGVLVEKQLDPSKYKKFNNNNGFVDGQDSTNPDHVDPNQALLEIVEEVSDEEEEEDEAEDAVLVESAMRFETKDLYRDIPQAFSCFTYRYTKRKMLVCDLQGVFNTSSSPALFELTDPVIHYSSATGRKNVYGRTDRGKKGMHDFFKTHKCGELCRMLRRKWSATVRLTISRTRLSQQRHMLCKNHTWDVIELTIKIFCSTTALSSKISSLIMLAR